MNTTPKNIDNYHPLHRKGNAWKYGDARGPTPMEASREENLASWVGEERATGVIAKLRPEPLAIGTLVDSIINGGQAESIQLVDKIRQQWEQIVGVDNAPHVQPLSIRNENLEIGFIDAAWRYVLDSPPQKVFILKRILELTGSQLKSVVFVPYVKK